MNTNINRYIKETPIKLLFFYPKKEVIFNSYTAFKKFIDKEQIFWGECNVRNAHNIYSKYYTLLSAIKSIEVQYSATAPYDEQWFINTLNSHIANFNNNSLNCNFLSDTPLSKRIKELSKENPTKMDAFIIYVQGGSLDTNNLVNLSGAIDADKYINQPLILDKIQEKYSQIIRESIDECIAEIDMIHKRYNDDYIKSVEDYQKLIEETNQWKENSEKQLIESTSKINSEFEEYINDKKKVLTALEALYNEKLRLESPAKYWLELEMKYKKEGTRWLFATLGISSILIAILLCILYNMPETLKISNIEFNFEALRSTVLLTVIISVGIYILRIFVKMAVSAYHLSRDAKERYQLSYFYLSLIKDTDIEPTDKAIVLQSLFSRADTGLLKGDSSPAFPVDGILSQIIKNVK